MKNWYAFRTEPMRELSAEMICGSRGIRAFVPREVKWTRRGPNRIRQPVIMPLLPRYLFAHLPDPTLGYYAMRAVKGIQGVVGFGGRPAPISNAAMERLAAMSQTEIPRSKEVPPIFTAGTRVQINAGPFTGHVVEVASIRGNHAKIMLKLFGTDQEAEIALEHLEAA